MNRRSQFFLTSLTFHCLFALALVSRVHLPIAEQVRISHPHSPKPYVLIYRPTRFATAELPHLVHAETFRLSFPKVHAGGNPTTRVQSGEIATGAFDRYADEAVLKGRDSDAGGVVVGGFTGQAAGGKRLEMVGTVGSTNFFRPSGPAKKEAMVLGEQIDDEPAQLLSAPVPTYTVEAESLNVTGVVLVEVELMASGEVRALRVLSGLGYGLDRSAIDAVNKTHCRPARRAGRPVDVSATISVIFKLT